MEGWQVDKAARACADKPAAASTAVPLTHTCCAAHEGCREPGLAYLLQHRLVRLRRHGVNLI